MRLFIAVDLPLDIKEKIKEVQLALKKCDLNAKWVNAENVHLTLKFLGEVGEDKIEEIKKIIETVAAYQKLFTVQFKDFGFFPNEKKPRVFFVSTSGEDILKSMANTLEEKLEIIGFKKEGRFRSHLTLARLRTPQNIDCLKNEIRKIKLEEKFLIKEIVLFKSTLKASGPIYEKIFISNLTA